MGARLSSDALTLRSLVGDALALVIQNITTVVVGLFMSFIANWKLAFIIYIPIPLVGLQEFLNVKFVQRFRGDVKAMYEDAVGNIRTVAAFCAEDKVMQMYERQCQAPLKRGVKVGILSGAGLGS